uniref:Uncharacterized protein n=1 Tax=Oryza brachyantha TaxID=4533 RepID=J3MVR8_ORYBR
MDVWAASLLLLPFPSPSTPPRPPPLPRFLFLGAFVPPCPPALRLLLSPSMRPTNDKFQCTAYSEMSLMASLSNPYIVDYKDGWVDEGTSACIVTSYCGGGGMAERIKKARGVLFSEERWGKYIISMGLMGLYMGHTNTPRSLNLPAQRSSRLDKKERTHKNTPHPQSQLAIGDVETGAKLREGRQGETHGEDVSQLGGSRDMENSNVADSNSVVDKVQVDLHILHPPNAELGWWRDKVAAEENGVAGGGAASVRTASTVNVGVDNELSGTGPVKGQDIVNGATNIA